MSRYEDFHVSKLRLGEGGDHVITDEAFDAVFTIGAEAANIIIVTVQLKDADGRNMDKVSSVKAFLASTANGDALAVVDAGLSVADGGGGWLSVLGDDQVFLVGTTAAGVAVIDITDTNVITHYLGVVMPNGKVVMSGAITFA